MGVELLDVPGGVWEMASAFPDIHGGPVNRTLIGHAVAADMVLVTADRRMHPYPVRTLW